MPINKNNDLDDLNKKKSFPDSYMSGKNDKDQQNLDEATVKRNKNLNDFFNRVMDPPSLDPNAGKDIVIPPTQIPKLNFPKAEPELLQNKLSKLKQYMPDLAQQEDVIPYDPNSGTMMNIGRFALNNLMTDQFSGGMPAAGTIKAVEKAGAISVPMIERLMGKVATPTMELMNVPKAAQEMNAAAEIAGTLRTPEAFLEQAKKQQALSRAQDFKNRLQQQIMNRKKGQ